MRNIFLFAIPTTVALVHAFALLAGRRATSRVHELAFYSGLLGPLCMPAAFVTFLLSGPLPVVGPVNPGFAIAFNVLAVSSLVLLASSAILAPYAVFKRAHPAA